MVISQPIRFPVKVQHHRPMQKPVEHGRGNGGVAKGFSHALTGLLIALELLAFSYRWLMTRNRADAVSPGARDTPARQ